MPRIQDIGAFNAVRESGLAKLMPSVPRLTVGMGTCGRGNGMEEVIGSIPIRSTNKPNNLADCAEKTRYAFDTLVLMLHPPQHFLRHSLNGPEEHRPPGFAPPAWLT